MPYDKDVLRSHDYLLIIILKLMLRFSKCSKCWQITACISCMRRWGPKEWVWTSMTKVSSCAVLLAGRACTEWVGLDAGLLLVDCSNRQPTVDQGPGALREGLGRCLRRFDEFLLIHRMLFIRDSGSAYLTENSVLIDFGDFCQRNCIDSHWLMRWEEIFYILGHCRRNFQPWLTLTTPMNCV